MSNRRPSLADHWNQAFASQDDQLAKVAAQHGMTPEQYVQAVNAEQKRQEMQKEAQKREDQAVGALMGMGMKDGLRSSLEKCAAQGGDRKAVEALIGHFCS